MPSEYEEVVESPVYSRWYQALLVLAAALTVAHLWTVWTIRADMNFVMHHLDEVTQQNKHMTQLLHTQRQVTWQIVPS